jgi:glycosyltransferase involved in cell wall biosynthesis
MKNMKVLITHELFPPEVWRMHEKLVYEITKRLTQNNVEVKVLTTGNPKLKRFDGIKTIRIPIHRYLMNLSLPWVLWHARDVDVIQTNNYNACFSSYLAGKILRKPVLCLISGMYGERWIEMRGPLLGRISMWVEKNQAAHDFTKVLFLSEYGKKNGIKIGIKRKLTQVLKPGIDFKKYKVENKEPFVLFVGRLSKQKGIGYLLEAARSLPGVRFVIVGTGEQEGELKKMAPPNVEFTGFISEKKLLDVYSRALIFCLPSLGETFGFVQLEAMASGCAIISTMPLDYRGKKIEAGDIKQLIESIKYLIRNRKIAEKMGRENRKIAETYKWDSFIKSLIGLYENSLRTRN